MNETCQRVHEWERLIARLLAARRSLAELHRLNADALGKGVRTCN